MANIFLTIEHDIEKVGTSIEVEVEKALPFLNTVGQKVPAASAALGIVIQAFAKALTDVAADVAQAETSPLTLTVSVPATYADLKAAWTDVVALLKTLGITIA